jgi:hypothetical protein
MAGALVQVAIRRQRGDHELGHVNAAILVRPGGGYRSRIRYPPVPGAFTRWVGLTSVQSSALARTTRSISRTSAKGLAKMRGRIIFTNGFAAGSSLMKAPGGRDADQPARS